MAISAVEVKTADPPAEREFGGLRVDEDWVRVFRIPPDHGDGVEVEIFLKRAPARFYRIKAPALDLDLSTGSSQEELVADLTNALIGGMLGVTE